MKILALSYLFPNPAHPEYGIFVHSRLKAVQERCSVKVIAPLQSYPLRNLLRPELARATEVGEKASTDGVETWHPRFTVIPRYLKSLDAFSYYLAVRPLVDRICREGYLFDVIDTHWTYPDILAAYLLARKYGRPFIVTVRGKEALYPGERGGRKRILDWCLRQADAVVALSSELASLVIALGVDERRVRVVLNGVNPGNFSLQDQGEARQRLGLFGESKILLSVGRLTEAKGHQHIIDALRLLGERQRLELHVIGGVNPESDYSVKLKSQVAALGLDNVVFHAGVPHDQLIHWYNAADLFCLASHGEGCPNVVLEALACGTPVVVSDVGSVRDIVAHPGDGVIAKDCNSFHEALGQALSGKWDRRAIAERMKKRSWQDCARQVVELYQEVAANPRHLSRQ